MDGMLFDAVSDGLRGDVIMCSGCYAREGIGKAMSNGWLVPIHRGMVIDALCPRCYIEPEEPFYSQVNDSIG